MKQQWGTVPGIGEASLYTLEDQDLALLRLLLRQSQLRQPLPLRTVQLLSDHPFSSPLLQQV